jgi:N utilization substance protein A
VLIPNALQPAQIEEVFLYPRLGRAIVLVKEDQLSLAIGRRGQNVRLASKLVGWDIEIMTHDELNEGIEKAENWFLQIPGATEELVEAFIEEGFLSYDDLTYLEPAQLAELAGVSEEQAADMIAFAEEASERVEEESRLARAAEAEARAAAPAGAPVAVAPRPGGTPRAADLFPEDGVATVAEARPTVESLWPDTVAPAEEQPAPDAAQVLGEPSPAAPAPLAGFQNQVTVAEEPAPAATAPEAGEQPPAEEKNEPNP